PRLRLGERRIGRDERDRRVAARLAFGAKRERFWRKRGGRAEPTELRADLVSAGPKVRALADDHLADGVDDDERADRVAVRRDGRRASEAPTQIRRCRPEAGASAADR